ncbi:TPA: hypothetical protein SLG40_003830 [Serratia odorifera]|nr:hypothetical protein [Serratia odorifera]
MSEYQNLSIHEQDIHRENLDEQSNESSYGVVSPDRVNSMRALIPPTAESDEFGASQLLSVTVQWVEDIGLQWLSIVQREWLGKIEQQIGSTEALSHLRDVLAAPALPLFDKLKATETFLVENDTDFNGADELLEVVKGIIQVHQFKATLADSGNPHEQIETFFDILKKLFSMRALTRFMHEEHIAMWRERIEKGQQYAEFVIRLMQLPKDDPQAFYYAMFESPFAPDESREMLMHSRNLFEELAIFMDVSEHQPAWMIRLQGYIADYNYFSGPAKKMLVLFTLLMDDDVIKMIEPYIERNIPEISSALKMTEMVGAELAEVDSQNGKVVTLLESFQRLSDKDFLERLQEESLVSNTALGNRMNIMLAQGGEYLMLDSTTMKVVNSMLKLLCGRIDRMQFANAIFGEFDFRQMLISMFSAMREMGSAVYNISGLIIKKLRVINSEQLGRVAWKDIPALLLKDLYDEAKEPYSKLFTDVDKLPLGPTLRAEIILLGDKIIDSANWLEALTKLAHHFAKHNPIVMIIERLIKIGVIWQIWQACQYQEDERKQLDAIEEAQNKLQSVLTYFPEDNYKILLDMVDWLPVLRGIWDVIKTSDASMLPTMESGDNRLSWGSKLLKELSGKGGAEPQRVARLQMALRRKMMQWVGGVSSNLEMAIEGTLNGKQSQYTDAQLSMQLSDAMQAQSQASSAVLAQAAGKVGNTTTGNQNWKWGVGAAAITAGVAGTLGTIYALTRNKGETEVTVDLSALTAEQIEEEKAALQQTLGQLESKKSIAKGVTIGSGVVSMLLLGTGAIVRGAKLYHNWKLNQDSSDISSEDLALQAPLLPTETQPLSLDTGVVPNSLGNNQVYNELSEPIEETSFISSAWSTLQKNEIILWTAGGAMLIPTAFGGWKWYSYNQQLKQLQAKLVALEMAQIHQDIDKDDGSYFDLLLDVMEIEHGDDESFFTDREKINAELQRLLDEPIDKLFAIVDAQLEPETLPPSSEPELITDESERPKSRLPRSLSKGPLASPASNVRYLVSPSHNNVRYSGDGPQSNRRRFDWSTPASNTRHESNTNQTSPRRVTEYPSTSGYSYLQNQGTSRHSANPSQPSSYSYPTPVNHQYQSTPVNRQYQPTPVNRQNYQERSVELPSTHRAAQELNIDKLAGRRNGQKRNRGKKRQRGGAGRPITTQLNVQPSLILDRLGQDIQQAHRHSYNTVEQQEISTRVERILSNLKKMKINIPEKLMDPEVYAKEEGEALYAKHGIRKAFDLQEKVKIKYKAWNDKPFDYLLDVLHYTSPVGLLIDYLVNSEISTPRMVPVDKILDISLKDLILGHERKNTGFTSYDFKYPEPSALFKDMSELDTPVKHMNELHNYFKNNKSVMYHAFEELSNKNLKKGLGKLNYGMAKDYDPLSRIKSRKAKIFKVDIKNKNAIDWQLNSEIDNAVYYNDRENRIEGVVFLNNGQAINSSSYADKSSIRVNKFQDIINIMTNIDAGYNDVVLNTYIIGWIPDGELNKADNKKLPDGRRKYSSEFIDRLRIIKKKYQRSGYENTGISVRVLSETSLNGEYEYNIEKLKKTYVNKMDRASTSKSELSTLTILHRLEFAMGMLGMAIALGSLISSPIVGFLTVAGPVLAMSAASGIQITRAAIADNSNEALEALKKWATTMYLETYGYVLGEFVGPISNEAKRIVSDRVANYVEKSISAAYTNAGLGLSGDAADAITNMKWPVVG